MKRIVIVFLFFSFVFSAAAGESWLNDEETPVAVFLDAELGAVGILHHTLQQGSGGTVFDYRTMGGQDILFPFSRLTAGITLGERHRISFLYQPLTIVTNVAFREDVTIDGTTFLAGTPMEITYGFPFYRLTYDYDFFESDSIDLAAGAALQLRNASLVFRALDGSGDLTANQNLGPVPALVLRFRYLFPSGLALSAEATGLYASSALINGASFDFEGSILDASLRAGYQTARGIEFYTNLRFLGGSAAGTSGYPDTSWTQSVEDYTANYLATLSLTLGAVIR